MIIDTSLTLFIWKCLSALPDIMWHKWFEICLHGSCGSKVPVDLYFVMGLANTKMSSSGRRGGKWLSGMLVPAHTLIMNSHTAFATWSPIIFAPEKNSGEPQRPRCMHGTVFLPNKQGRESCDKQTDDICFSVTVVALVLITNARRYTIMAKASSKLLPQLWFLFFLFLSAFLSSFFMLQG